METVAEQLNPGDQFQSDRYNERMTEYLKVEGKEGEAIRLADAKEFRFGPEDPVMITKHGRKMD